MKITKSQILISIVVIIFVVAIFLIPKGDETEEKIPEPIFPVKTIEIKKGNLQEYLSLNGNIEAKNTVSVFPDNNGKIYKNYVSLGSSVKKGQKISDVNPSFAGSEYALSPVFAPISGTITAIPLAVGTKVSTTTEITTIGNVEQLQLAVSVPERYISVLQTGLQGEVSLIAYKDEKFMATVTHVSPIVDERSRTKQVLLGFHTKDSRINAGMYAKVKLNTVLHENIIAIPSTSIVSIDKQQYVFLANDNKAKLKPVVSGINVDGMVEIKDGLSENDCIIITGVQSLEDGVQIRIVED